jgi:CAAX prenyl protease-like protein
MTQPTHIDYPPLPPKLNRLSDDLAYIVPMGIFLAFTFAQGQWPATYALCYLLKTIATAVALAILWKRYTPLRWNSVGLGLIVGILGTFQWIGMQLWLQKHFSFFTPAPDQFNPYDHFHTRTIAIRLIGAVLVVPVMEELFWRDFMWRQILAPNDFKLAAVGEWSPLAVLLVSGAFATVHGNWWLTAIVWGLMIALLLAYTKSLGACIVAHATTNLLLGIYVLRFHRWELW